MDNYLITAVDGIQAGFPLLWQYGLSTRTPGYFIRNQGTWFTRTRMAKLLALVISTQQGLSANSLATVAGHIPAASDFFALLRTKTFLIHDFGAWLTFPAMTLPCTSSQYQKCLKKNAISNLNVSLPVSSACQNFVANIIASDSQRRVTLHRLRGQPTSTGLRHHGVAVGTSTGMADQSALVCTQPARPSARRSATVRNQARL